MKTRKHTSNYKVYLAFLLALVIHISSAFAQNKVEPTVITQSAKVNANPKVEVIVYDVPTEIMPANNNTIKAELEYYAQGKQEDLKKLKQFIEENLLTVYSGDNSAKLVLNLHHNLELEIMGMKWSRVKISHSNKKDVIKLKEFQIRSYKIWLPSTMQLNLNAKYSKVAVNTNINGHTNFEVYDSQLTCQSISGDVSGQFKYSSLNAHSLGNLDLDLYETKLKAEECLLADLKAKYSEISIRNMQQLNYDGYEGNLYLSHVPRIHINSKYTDLSIVSADKLDIEAYEGQVKLGKIGSLTVAGKYFELKGETLQSLTMHEGYENEVKFEKIGILQSTDGKYNEFSIGEITRSLVIDGYEEEVDVEKMNGQFDKIELSGKYLETDITLYQPQPYVLKGTVQYPELEVNEKAYQIRKKIGDSSKLEFEYIYGQAAEDAPTISINGYECGVNLQHAGN